MASLAKPAAEESGRLLQDLFQGRVRLKGIGKGAEVLRGRRWPVGGGTLANGDCGASAFCRLPWRRDG